MSKNNSNTKPISDLSKALLPVRFSTIIAFFDGSYNSQITKFKEKVTYEEFKDNIKYAFSKGVRSVRLYENYRKKDDFLEIRKEDFLLDEIELGYRKIQLKNKIKLLEFRKINNNKSIEFHLKANDKIDKEIIYLSTFANW